MDFSVGQETCMSDIGHYVGPFAQNAAIRLFHNHRLDPATKGKHLIRLPDRSLVWSDEYEQRLREYQSKQAPLFSDQTGTALAGDD
jgi:hypothetical protein